MADREEHSETSTGELMRLLSHQMKAPVHAVQALLQAVFDSHGQEIPPAVRDALERAMSRAGEASTLVDDLLEYQSYAAGRKGDRHEFEILSLVSDLALQFSLGAAAQDVSVDLSLPEDRAAFVAGLRTGIEHAIRNLIDNAVKYSSPLGRVEVAVSLDETKREVRIAVSDTGRG
ncbi:sensor histidine kinase, partial [Salinispira pacifica]